MESVTRTRFLKTDENLFKIVFLCILMASCLLACATPVPLPTPKWGGKYSYTYNPPDTSADRSVPLRVLVVNPSFREEESALGSQGLIKVGRGLSKSMGVDIDKIVLAKGIAAVGPFSSLDEITYVAKKDADLTLAPRVFITTETKYGDWRVVYYGSKMLKERDFDMKIEGWLSFVMQEPLSGEKMWIKKIELDEIIVKNYESYEASPVYQGSYVVDYKTGDLVFNGVEEAMADALKTYYPIVMEKLWTYLDKDEMLVLKERAQEIRKVKVY